MAQRRTAGLTQRNKGLSQQQDGSQFGGDSHKVIASPDQNEEDPEETMDKQTRLTLMEEVLLLGLKDKEVIFSIYIFTSLIMIVGIRQIFLIPHNLKEKRLLWSHTAF